MAGTRRVEQVTGLPLRSNSPSHEDSFGLQLAAIAG